MEEASSKLAHIHRQSLDPSCMNPKCVLLTAHVPKSCSGRYMEGRAEGQHVAAAIGELLEVLQQWRYGGFHPLPPCLQLPPPDSQPPANLSGGYRKGQQ